MNIPVKQALYALDAKFIL